MNHGLLTLLRLQGRLWRNAWRPDSVGRARRTAAVIAVPVFMIGLVVGTHYFLRLSGLLELYSLAVISDIAKRSAANMTVESLAVSTTITFVIVCLGAVDQAYETFYLAPDLELLLSAPISRQAIFVFRFLMNLRWDAQMVTVLALPIWLGFGAWLGAPLLFYVALPIGWLLLLAIVSGLGTTMAMGLTRYVPAPRLRQIMLSFTLTIGVLLVIGLQGLVTGLWTRDGIVRLLEARALSRQVWLPSVWLSRCLVAVLLDNIHDGLPWFLTLLAGAILAVALARRVSMRVYTAGWSNAQESSQRPVRQVVRRRSSTWHGPLWAMIRKDLLVFFRQPVHWYQAVMGTVAIVMVLINFMGQSRTAAGALMISLVMSYVGASTFAMNLSLRAVGGEGLCWWLLQTAPMSTSRLLLAKTLTAWLPTVLYALISLIAMQTILGLAWHVSLLTIPILTVMITGMTLVDITVGLWRTDFERATETRNADIVAVLVSQGLNYVLLSPAVLLLALPPFLASWGLDLTLPYIMLAMATAALLLNSSATIVCVRLGLRLLAKLRLAD